jgi:hypothetical protein
MRSLQRAGSVKVDARLAFGGGYLVENDAEDSVLYGIMARIMGLFE